MASSGVSGVATKTSYALFLLYGVLQVYGIVLALLAILYIGAYLQVAVAQDGLSPRDGLRASWRASRILGTGHSYLISGYLLFVIVLALITPGRPGVATPTVAVWAYALFASLLHIAFLSTFVHRWQYLRPQALEGTDAAVPDEAASRQ